MWIKSPYTGSLINLRNADDIFITRPERSLDYYLYIRLHNDDYKKRLLWCGTFDECAKWRDHFEKLLIESGLMLHGTPNKG